MEWYDVPATDLDARQLHDILALRAQVFVVEQQCAYLDVDGLDLLPTTRHLWATDLAAYARLLGPTPDDADGAAHIGRVIVSPTARGTAAGSAAAIRFGGLGNDIAADAGSAGRDLRDVGSR